MKNIIENFNKIVILSGAGTSTSSGIEDYKSKSSFHSKLYNDDFEYSKIMNINTFNSKKRILFYEYYENMIELFKNKKPSKPHKFAKYLYDKGKLTGVITQNIDGLYCGLIPNEKLVELHGNYNEYLCVKCGSLINKEDVCVSKNGNFISSCHNFLVKPNVVLFGETYSNENIKTITSMIAEADCLIVMGTQLNIIYINDLVANFNGSKILINDSCVDILKRYRTPYGEESSYKIDWDFTFIGDISEKIQCFI